jgi:hypothetical protein
VRASHYGREAYSGGHFGAEGVPPEPAVVRMFGGDGSGPGAVGFGPRALSSVTFFIFNITL